MRIKTRKVKCEDEIFFAFQWRPELELFHKASNFYEIFPVKLFSELGTFERCSHKTCDPEGKFRADIVNWFNLDVKRTLAILDYSSFNAINTRRLADCVCHIHFRDAARTTIDGVNWKNNDVPKFIKDAVTIRHDFKPRA